MDFREVAAALHGADVETHSIDLAGISVRLVTAADSRRERAVRTVVFDRVTSLKWSSSAERASSVITLSTVGLERLGADEPWRLYIRTPDGAELELSALSVSCDGEEVTGVGRSYRH